MTDREAAERREMIRAFYQKLKTDYDAVRKARGEIERSPGPGFGCYDDDAYEKAQRESEKQASILYEREQGLEAMWQLVKSVFGDKSVALAIEEGEERIGELPYCNARHELRR